jgi:hypothetical protein
VRENKHRWKMGRKRRRRHTGKEEREEINTDGRVRDNM